MKILTLGNCCNNSRMLHANAEQAAKNCGVEAPENVENLLDIIKFGVFTTPALVIDGKVVSSGKVLSVNEIEALIRANL